MSYALTNKQLSRLAFTVSILGTCLGTQVLAVENEAAGSETPPAVVDNTPATEPEVKVAVCFQPPAKLSDAEVQAFLGAPSAVLTQNADNGLQLSSQVRALAGSSGATLDPLMALVPTANPQQIAAIGAGLARAARACATIDPAYAALVQEKVAALNNNALNVAFSASLQDVQTAALGAGGAAGGSAAAAGIGGGGVAGGGTRGADTDEATATTSGTFSVTASGDRYFSDNSAGGATAPSGSFN